MTFTVHFRWHKPSARHDPPAILTLMIDRAPLFHEDVGAAVQAVIPPRRVPLGKRVFWRVVLWLMTTATGRSLIARRYRPLQSN
jgi:hypothetical protein